MSNLNVKELTKIVFEKLGDHEPDFINKGIVMAVMVAAEQCGILKEPSNQEVNTTESNPCEDSTPKSKREIKPDTVCPICGKGFTC